ncbi:MAG: CheR family methyltransferase [Nannocystales bacterium]
MDVSVPPAAAERVFVLVASAGGYDAVVQVLESVGQRSPHAFVVAIKASEGPSMLRETLELRTTRRLVEVESVERLEAGAVYLAAPAMQLVISETSVGATPRAVGASGLDAVLHSAAQTWGPKATAVVLAGGGAPVQSGAQAILDAGGELYCQSPSTASIDDMLRGVLGEVGASGVGSCAEIGGWIRDGLSADVRDTGDPERLEDPLAPAFWVLLERLRGTMGVDLYAYRTATFYRRVTQRARVLGLDGLEAYVDRALSDTDELKALASRLLIGTTDFFRNGGLFDDLRRWVVPALCRQPSLTVWCAGCSTGEEAYSVAAFLHSEFEAAGSSTRLSVLATDVRADAIAHAAAGSYSLPRVANIPSEFRTRYGTIEDGRWTVGKILRGCVRFSVHDVLADPPPEGRDLVLFRNVMIYLRPEVHPRALAKMHEALLPGGFLAVGESESTHSLGGRFARAGVREGAILRRI